MGTFSLRVLQLLIAVIILLAAEWPGGVQGGQSHAGKRVIDLLKLQGQAEDGVIQLNDELVKKFASPGPEPRPYTVFIFFDAEHMRDNRDLDLVAHRAEFGLVATAFVRNNPHIQQVFFADLNFVESEWSFKTFRVKKLPHIRYLPPGNGSLEESESMNWKKDGMVQFVEAKTRQTVGPLESPSEEFTKKQLTVLVGGLLVASPFVISMIMAKDTLMHDAKFWIFNALLVYFFIMSGGMLDVIQGMPFFIKDPDRPEQPIFFIQGRSTQLGAEGIVVASLYTLVGLFLAFATQFLHKIRSKTVHQILLPLVMVICFFSVRSVIVLNNWKTGYSIHGYWPRGWSPNYGRL